MVSGMREAVSQIASGRIDWEYRRIIVGLPLSTSGQENEIAREVLKFVERLRAACPVPVEMVDERFSSQEAERLLHATGKKIKGHKGDIDRLAAEILLRGYLDRLDGMRDGGDE